MNPQGRTLIAIDRVVDRDTGEELPDGGVELGKSVVGLLQRTPAENLGDGKYVTHSDLGYDIYWSVGQGQP